MTYKFTTEEEKKEHYKKMHTDSCRIYNLKNKERAKKIYEQFEKTKRINRRCDDMVFKLELLRFATIDGIFK